MRPCRRRCNRCNADGYRNLLHGGIRVAVVCSLVIQGPPGAAGRDRGRDTLMGDLLYNFTDWLRETPLTELALWISDTSLCLWIVSNFWVLPVIQVVHILAIA